MSDSANKTDTKPVNEIPLNPEFSESLRAASGDVHINSKLVSFLYELMRDHLPAGVVTRVVINSPEPDVSYTNGYLARHAEFLAKKLTE